MARQQHEATQHERVSRVVESMDRKQRVAQQVHQERCVDQQLRRLKDLERQHKRERVRIPAFVLAPAPRLVSDVWLRRLSSRRTHERSSFATSSRESCCSRCTSA